MAGERYEYGDMDGMRYEDGMRTAGLVKSADLLTLSEPDAGSSAPDGNI